jgi:hypothetical protein
MDYTNSLADIPGHFLEFHKDYQEVFDAIQKFVDEQKVNISLAKKLVETLNQEAHNNNVPIKFDPDILDVTVFTHPIQAEHDTIDMMYPDEASSLDEDNGSSYM